MTGTPDGFQGLQQLKGGNVRSKIKLIGVPLDLGQSHRGVDMGPSAVRYAGLAVRLANLGHEVWDCGNLSVPVRETLSTARDVAYLAAITRVCKGAYQAARDAVGHGFTPVFIGGDHSLAIGTIGGITEEEPAGVIYIDAHGDFNTPKTSPSGNIHGMVLSHLLGDGYARLVNLGRKGPKLKAEDVVLVGVRDLDPKERLRLKEQRIRVFTMRDIDEQGMGNIARQSLDILGHHSRIHVSLDADVLDPMEAPGVGTPTPGGITYREAQLLMEIIADSRRLSSLDVVEINPVFDNRNHSAMVVSDLTASIFGERIL
ncbi:arginase [Geotalea daltonii FRC-32]|uniref:Arginase n=1 Tax=Geotalea daltonii (strain DSM 22248 / JCM 15807 / FRC-32) TaxID=316067 RepID=B9M2J5_GEODF|nr:arginase [Geotalea daltonii FRC-32]